MALPVFQIGLVLGGFVVAATGAYVVIVKPGGVLDRTPGKTLADDEELAKEYRHQDKGGGKYARFLLDGVNPANAKYGKEQHDKFVINSKKPTTGKFSQVTQPFGTGEESLNHVCNNAYITDKSKVTQKGDQEGEYKEGEVGAFCSTVGGKITTISEVASETSGLSEGTYGDTYKEELVVTTEKVSNGFWKAQADEVKNHYGGISPETNEFKKLSDELKNAYTNDPDNQIVERTETSGSNESAAVRLRQVCKAAHSANIEDKGMYPKAEVLKFCSLTYSSDKAAS